MQPQQDPTYDIIAYYRSSVGPHPVTEKGKVPVDVFDPRWYSEIQGWSALYYGANALVLIMAPIATHQAMATGGRLHLLNQMQVVGIKTAVQAQQNLPSLPAMGTRRNRTNRQRLYTP